MIISVPNRSLQKQAFETSCWISAAYFVLQYIGSDVSLSALHAQYYRPDPTSRSVMAGAGNSRKILEDYAHEYNVAAIDPQTTSKSAVVDAIAESIRAGIPVIASIRTPKIKGRVSLGHAVVITAIDDKSGTIGFKDPAKGVAKRTFGLDIRTIAYDVFVINCPYTFSNSRSEVISTYCSQITYLEPATLFRGMFD
jgi:hypothetical protein